MEIEVEIDGEQCVVTCPICKGEGQIEEFPFRNPQGWITHPFDEPVTCPICKGKGTLDDVPVFGTVPYELEPPVMNEGYV